jgi:hypothetical protein
LSSHWSINIIIARHSCRDSFGICIDHIHENNILEGIATTVSSKAKKAIILTAPDKHATTPNLQVDNTEDIQSKQK